MATTEELERRRVEVDAAISNIMRTGQMVQTRNGRVEHANLAALREERAAIEKELADAQSYGSSGESWGTKMSFYGRG